MSEEAINLIGHYINNSDGTVTDPRTGLMWMRCSIGQTWDGNTCQGEAINYTWDEAKKLRCTFAWHDDWRLPSIDELKTLINMSQGETAIDHTAFPNAPRSRFWSSSPPEADDSRYVWIIDFDNGAVIIDYRSVRYAVRLVRGGKSLPDLDLNVTRNGKKSGAANPSPAVNTNDALDEIMVTSEIQQLISIAVKSGQPISTFCREQYKNFSFSVKELYAIITNLIGSGQIDYSSGILAQVSKQHKFHDIGRELQCLDRMSEKTKGVLLSSSLLEKNHELSQGGSSTDSLWADLVNHSWLSVRASNVILKNFSSREELLSASEESLSILPNCGRKTVEELAEFINKMRGGEFAPVIPVPQSTLNVTDIFLLPPTEESLNLLPIFSSRQLYDISVDKLHDGFHPEILLADIVLSVRTASVLECLGCKTIGELMLIPSATLFAQKNFGRRCFSEIQGIIKRIVLVENDQVACQAYHLDFTSYGAMVKSLVERCLKERDHELVAQRLCFLTGKIPTLEQLGEQFGITRERARQILKKGYETLKIKANLNLLKGFSENVDDIVTIGGGIISLGDLTVALQEKYGWSTPPHPPALGQLLSLLKPNKLYAGAGDLVVVECECLNCSKPFEKLLSLDFEKHESFHIQVVASILTKYCQMSCSIKSVQKFHLTYIEMLIRRTNGTHIIHDDLIMLRDRWLPRYGIKLEDIIIRVLERNGKPMHFIEIAAVIQKENLNYCDISDHNVHAALMRFDAVEIISRGIYGLKCWGMGGYRSVSTAIEELIDSSQRPLRRSEIIQQLSGEFSEGNIAAALSKETRFISVGEGFYDRPEKWRQRTCQSLIDHLPKPLADFASYLVIESDYSYKLVFALVFFRGMDENGSFPLQSLKVRFFNYYLARKKQGVVVETSSAIISRIGEIEDSVIRNDATSEPINSFLSTPFFSKNGSSFILHNELLSLLSDLAMRDILMIILLKKIYDYFADLTPAVLHKEVITHTPSDIGFGDDDNAASSSITIKKKDRGKIRL